LYPDVLRLAMYVFPSDLRVNSLLSEIWSRHAEALGSIDSGDTLPTAVVQLQVDLSKVQQLLVTLSLVATCVFLLAQLFNGADQGIDSLPLLDEHFVYLLALSHAGYLAYTATPKSSQTSPDTAHDH
jgi:hypothetical protein